MREVDAFSVIVGSMYDAALDPDLWPEVLRLSCEYIDGVSGALLSHDLRDRSAQFFRSWNDDPVYTKLYFDKYVRLNPVLVPLMNVKEGDVVAISTLIPHEEFHASRFHQEWARPQGYVDLISACVSKTGSSIATVTITRDETREVADEGAFERMRCLTPHFRRAVAVGNIVRQSRVVAAQLTDTLDGIAAAVFVVDASRNVVHANIAGNRLLDAGTLFRTPSRRLVAVDPTANQQLADAIAAAEDGDLSMAFKGGGIPLRNSNNSLWVAHVLPLTSGQRRRAGAAYSAVAAVFIRSADLDYSTPVETAGRIYQLTDAELRVLFAVVVSEGIADTAAILGLSQSTVRTHLQSVFRKTGTSRQPALIKLVAGLMNPLMT